MWIWASIKKVSRFLKHEVKPENMNWMYSKGLKQQKVNQIFFFKKRRDVKLYHNFNIISWFQLNPEHLDLTSSANWLKSSDKCWAHKVRKKGKKRGAFSHLGHESAPQENVSGPELKQQHWTELHCQVHGCYPRLAVPLPRGVLCFKVWSFELLKKHLLFCTSRYFFLSMDPTSRGCGYFRRTKNFSLCK